MFLEISIIRNVYQLLELKASNAFCVLITLNFLLILRKTFSMNLICELNKIYHYERIFLSQNSGINWNKFRDCNSKYFHIVSKVIRVKGKIPSLQDHNLQWITDQSILKNMSRENFVKILSSTTTDSAISLPFNFNNIVTAEQVVSLSSPITEEEVKSNLFRINPIKCPGPDGIQLLFLQKH